MAIEGLHFKNTDGTRWGSGDGAGTDGRLSSLQGDENIWLLRGRVKDMEDNPPTAVSILGFTVIGSQMQVNMSDGSTQGPFDLPIATFRLVGEWVNSMALLKLDIFTVEHDGVYFVNLPHTTPASPATFDPEATDGSGNPLYTKIFGDDPYIYDLGWFYPGAPGQGIDDGSPMAGHEIGRPVLFPTGLPDSKGSLRVAPASDLSFPIEINGVVKGSMDFASGATAATFTWSADVSCAVGDVVYLMKPTALDPAARDLTATLILTREFDT